MDKRAFLDKTAVLHVKQVRVREFWSLGLAAEGVQCVKER